MALRLIDKIPIIQDIGFMKKYARYLHTAEFKVDPLLWITLSTLISLTTAIGTWYFIDQIIQYTQGLQLALLAFMVIIDLLIGYPYLIAQRRIDAIEESLPDALRQMADTLRSGGTYEYALREVAMSEYGPLKKEMNEVMRKLEEGENFENSLMTLSHNIDSRLVQRTVTIIIDSVAAGAGLASVLDEISEDVRAAHRIDKERKARTILQVIFMFVAGGFIAPMIFGFVTTITEVLINAATSVATQQELDAARNALDTINISIQFYIFFQALITSMMISLMREGKMSKSIIYFPILLFIAYISYLLAVFGSGVIVG